MNNTSCPLLCRTPLRDGESLLSLLTRLIQLNCYDPPTILFSLCRERAKTRDDPTKPTSPEMYQAVAGLVNIDVNTLYAATPHLFAAGVIPPAGERKPIVLSSGQTVLLLPVNLLREYMWPDSDLQFCPHCLAESAYHRLDWLPIAASVCLRHQCLLVRRCPRCQNKLSILDILERQCQKCRFNLIEAHTTHIAADEFGLFSQAVIQSWLLRGIVPQSKLKANYTLLDKSPSVLWLLLDGFRRSIMKIRRTWYYLYQSPSGVSPSIFPCLDKKDIFPAQSYIIYATALKALLNWPQGFYDFLDAYLLRDERKVEGQISKDLAPIYYWIEKGWQATAFDFVRRTFGRYLADNLPLFPALPITPIMQKPIFNADFPYIYPTEAAQVLGTSQELIERLAQEKYLATCRELKDGKLLHLNYHNWVSRADVAELQQKWQNGIPTSDAARILGISEEILLDLVNAGIITATFQAITHFQNELRGSTRQWFPPTHKRQPLSINTVVTNYGLSAAEVVRRVLAKEVRGYWPKDGRLDQLRIHYADAEALAKQLQN